jgi:uncharacterized protein (TIGR03067 family)
MRRSLSAVLVGTLLVAATALAADADKSKKELEKFQGTWVCQKFINDGDSAPAEAVAQLTFTFKDDKVTTNTDPDDPATITLRPEKAPAEIDFTDKDKKVDLGIYEIKGDELTMCMAPSQTKTERPTKFDAPKGSKYMLVVFKKQAAK